MNQPTNQPARVLPRDLSAPVLPSDVGYAHLTARVVHEFGGLMAEKMAYYQGRFDTSWVDKSWTRHELDLQIARCILDEDYVSVANYAMMAHHFGSQESVHVPIDPGASSGSGERRKSF